jgi:hypothetical protein
MMIYADRHQAARAVVLRLVAVAVAVSLMIVLIGLSSQHRVPRGPSFLARPDVMLVEGGTR